MARADRAFAVLVAASVLSATVLAVPLAITLFPDVLRYSLHGYDALAQACAAALYQLGLRLPPLGAAVLALTVASLGLGATRYLRMQRRTARLLRRSATIATPARLRSAAERVGIVERTVYVADRVPYAFCAGLLRPRIWISSGAVRRLRRHELEAVLWHEAHHLRRRDPLRIVVARVVAALLFAVPVVRLLADRFAAGSELDADRATVRAQAGVGGLAGALLKLDRPLPFTRAEVAVGAWSVARERVNELCGAPSSGLPMRAVARAALISAATLALALLLALGQTARANAIPSHMLEAIGLEAASERHLCPLPQRGILL